MAYHVMINLDKVMAIYSGNMESVVYTSDMDNGSFGVLGTVSTTDREVRNFGAPTDVTTEEVVMVASGEDQVPMLADGNGNFYRLDNLTLKDFYIPVNKVTRAIHFNVGDIITITDNGITGATNVGQYCIPANGSMKLSASATIGTTKLAFKVLEKTTFGYTTNGGYTKAPATVLQVVKA